MLTADVCIGDHIERVYLAEEMADGRLYAELACGAHVIVPWDRWTRVIDERPTIPAPPYVEDVTTSAVLDEAS
jgi:hypothetical protein